MASTAAARRLQRRLLRWYRAPRPRVAAVANRAQSLSHGRQRVHARSDASRPRRAEVRSLRRTLPRLRRAGAAPLADVLRQWKGLGYNSRAVRLHRLARAVVERVRRRVALGRRAHCARCPASGRIRVAAIRAFAFNLDDAPVDTNVRRIVHRLFFGLEHPPAAGAREARRKRARAGSARARARLELGADGSGRIALHRARAEVPALSAARAIAPPHRSTPPRSRRARAASAKRRSPQRRDSLRAEPPLRARAHHRPAARTAARTAHLAARSARGRCAASSRPAAIEEIREVVAALERDGLIDARRGVACAAQNRGIGVPRIPFPTKKVTRKVALEELAILERTYPHAVTALEYRRRLPTADRGDSLGATHRRARQHDDAGALREVSDARKARAAPIPPTSRASSSRCGFFRMKTQEHHRLRARSGRTFRRQGSARSRSARIARRRRPQNGERRDGGGLPRSGAGRRHARLSRLASLGLDARHDSAPGGRRRHEARAARKVGRRDALADSARTPNLQGADAAMPAVPGQRTSARRRGSSSVSARCRAKTMLPDSAARSRSIRSIAKEPPWGRMIDRVSWSPDGTTLSLRCAQPGSESRISPLLRLRRRHRHDARMAAQQDVRRDARGGRLVDRRKARRPFGRAAISIPPAIVNPRPAQDRRRRGRSAVVAARGRARLFARRRPLRRLDREAA